MKRWISILLCAILLCSMLCISLPVSAANVWDGGMASFPGTGTEEDPYSGKESNP